MVSRFLDYILNKFSFLNIFQTKKFRAFLEKLLCNSERFSIIWKTNKGTPIWHWL